MPVIQLSIQRLKALAKGKTTEKEIIEMLPYLGLDLEDQVADLVSVEYSPNRPDFSSEVGIARSLLGFLNIESGAPSYRFENSDIALKVEEDEIRKTRPYVSAFVASIDVTEDLIKQLIAMQEDLTNGIGRRRAKVAVGIHNAEAIKPPIRYFATHDKNFSFVPLYGTKPETISTILKETVQGRQYSQLVSSGVYPMLEDSSGGVLSMPPIINGELTRLKPGIRSLFFDVTSTEERAGDAVSAIIASMISDSGGKVKTIRVEGNSVRLTPIMEKRKMRFDLGLANGILGLSLSLDEAKNALGRSRLTLESEDAFMPAFRSDIIHPIDLVEEVELGYGVARLSPEPTSSPLAGSVLPFTKKIGNVVDVMVGLGLTEIFTLSLTGKLEADLAKEQDIVLKVDDAKSESYEYVKSELFPSLLRVLGSSTHEEYPQKVFEVAPVFMRGEVGTGVQQEEHVAAAIADSSADFTEIKSLAEGFLRLLERKGTKIEFVPKANGIFVPGRSSAIVFTKKSGESSTIGLVGEVSPEIIDRLGLKVPVAGLEISLERMFDFN